MAATLRHSASGLADVLYHEGARFSFFQAVRLLERLQPERALVGGVANPGNEIVRFSAHLSLAFPATEITPPRTGGPVRGDLRTPFVIAPARGVAAAPASATSMRDTGTELHPRPAQMTVTFLGLTGPRGTLPYHYTELLLDRVLRHRDHTLRDFLDIFNHRLVSLFYRAWAKHRPTLSFERRARGRTTPGGVASDDWESFFSALIGMGTAGLGEQLSFTARGLLSYAGLLSQWPRSATALEQLLRDALSEPKLRVLEFIGQHYELSPESQTCLGVDGCELGMSPVLGDRVLLQDAKFRIQIGPLRLDAYRRFLPAGVETCGDGALFSALVELTQLFVGPALEFDIELVLDEAESVGLCLGETGAVGPRLGMSTWLVHSERPLDQRASLFASTLHQPNHIRRSRDHERTQSETSA